MLRRMLPVALVLTCVTSQTLAGQRPAPFPQPGEPQRSAQTPPAAKPAAPSPSSATAPPQSTGAPDEALLGVPIYPGAQFIASFDAGRNQRYYLFGTNTGFAEIVTYYKTALKQRGELVYEEPPIHEFDVGRFREETMAFPPGVTVKDYTTGGSQGYLNPKRGAEPARFKTIIQFVPVVP